MPDTWVTPRVWVTSERVGQSKMNEISNNLRVLFPYTTGGDISYRDPAGAYLTRLPIGAAYKTLRSTGAVMEWGGYIAGKAVRNSNYSIANVTSTYIPFTSAEISQNVTWDIGDATKLTIAATGLYLIGATHVTDGGSGYRQANIVKNSTAVLETRENTSAGETTYLSISGIALLSAGDYLRLAITQNEGVSINVRAAGLYAALLGV